ncbi:exonuclease [Arthrobacter crystallopoietes BAB-32]|uniref:Exonuclease n=1 Tax=Arthrobacter crystallopoietes BAB-32 TaxID=1246476 RepID=N1VCX2_9MICC|nr:exonuclease [Arthrobacter crystallopoietes BAB-32]
MKVFQNWKEAEFCCLDFETTGLDPLRDNIIAYGAVPISAGRIIPSQGRYSLVNPGMAVSKESTMVHAIRQCDLEQAPSLDDCLNDIKELLAGRILVAHSAWVERGFLRRALSRRGLRLDVPILDTAALARACVDLPELPRGQDVSLEYVSALLDLPVHTPHHALGDAMTTAQLFIVLASRLSKGGPCRLGKLAILSRR